MITKQTEIQRKIINTIKENNFKGIVLSSVRSGKTRILLTAIKEHNTLANPRILVMYPNIDVRRAWEDECTKIGCPFEIKYCTFISIEKVMEEEWDYIIFDEAHLIPKENKLPLAGMMAKNNKHVIFASGTYSKSTLNELIIYTSLPQIVDYTTDEAIVDDIVNNFTVYIHTYKLDETKIRSFRTGRYHWKNTDSAELERLTEEVFTRVGIKKKLAAISRMRFINSNDSLREAVNDWINKNPNERLLLFVNNGVFGKKFGLWMFNSKSKDDVNLQKFIKGDINRLCLIKKGSAGVTYPNLNNIIITSVNSNGENLEQMLGRSLLKDTPSSKIHIFTTEHSFQLNWIKSALFNIDNDKIIWL